MSTSLRSARPLPRRGPRRESVETLQARLAGLVAERQSLRSGSGDALQLEANRLEIAQLQQQLSQALIDRHCVRPAEQSAA